MIILDTDTVTHLSYGNANVRKRIDGIGDDEELAVSSITRYEILRGRAESVLKAADEAELRKAAERYRKDEETLSTFVIADINEDAIQHFGRLGKQKNLKKMGRADMLIACIALAHKALLVTRNTKDYKNVADLRTENWVD